MLLLRVGFLVTGILTVLLGQILPVLSRQLSLTDQEAGSLFICQFGGSLLGAFCYSSLSNRYGYPKILAASCVLMICGTLMLNLGSWFSCVAAISIYGFGIGLTIPTTNMFVVELDHSRSASNLSIVNFFWGFGAILSKPFVDITQTTENIFITTAALATALTLVMIVFLVYDKRVEKVSVEIQETSSPVSIWTMPFAWLLAVFNFIHIGVESSVGGWITTYQDRVVDSGGTFMLSAASLFFLTLVIGRMLGPVIFRLASESSVIFFSLAVMIVGTGVILYAETLSALLLGAVILGFGCSVVFPTNMSRFTGTFGPGSTQKAMPLFVLSSLGGAFITWLVGYVSTHSGDLRSGFYVILGCSLSLMALNIIISRMQKGNWSIVATTNQRPIE